VYYACNVSTCNQKRTALCFCSVSCWEVHLPGANHRESWAVEKRAPTSPSASEMTPRSSSGGAAGSGAPRPPPHASGTGLAEGQSRRPGNGVRRLVRTPSAAPAPDPVPREVLIVASRLRDYVRARAGYNTSDRVLEPLSDIVRRVVDEAIESARRDGRMTVLDRDIETS
jgi:hypothetical protein